MDRIPYSHIIGTESSIRVDYAIKEILDEWMNYNMHNQEKAWSARKRSGSKTDAMPKFIEVSDINFIFQSTAGYYYCMLIWRLFGPEVDLDMLKKKGDIYPEYEYVYGNHHNRWEMNEASLVSIFFTSYFITN